MKQTTIAVGVVVAAGGSAEAKAARAAGKLLVAIDGADGKPNVSLGWWWMGDQVGTACFLYLAAQRVGRSHVLSCHGLDLVSETPEGNSLLRNFVRYLAGQEGAKAARL